MLTSPLVLTISGVDTDYNRVITKETASQYASATGEKTIDVSHQATSKRKRHMVKVTSMKIAADPLTSVNVQQSASVHIVIDEPIVGFSDAELDAIVQGLKTWLSTANVTAVLSGRH